MYWYEEGVSVRVVRFSERESRSPGCEVILVRSKGGKLRGAATTALLLLALHAGLIHSRLQEWLVYCITSSLGAAYVLCAIVLTVYKERVVVLRSLGVHVATTYWSGHTSSLFIPHFAISDIIINEAVTMHKVIFYLAILLKEESGGVRRLIPLLTEFNPRLSVIEMAYHEVRCVLYSDAVT